jgi:hypothetical protein
VARGPLAVVELAIAFLMIVLRVEGTKLVKPFSSDFTKDGAHEGKPQVFVVGVRDVTIGIIDALTKEFEILLVGHC